MQSLTLNQPIPEALISSTILDENNHELKLSGILSADVTLVVFVRHFGCIGCTLQMNSIAPRLDEFHALGIKTVVIGNGAPNYIEGFKERHLLKNKPIEIYTDPSLTIYNNAQLKRSYWNAFGPKFWYELIIAWSKGVGQKSIEGDNAQMGGSMLIGSDHKLLYYYRNSSVANHFDTTDMMDAYYNHLGTKK